MDSLTGLFSELLYKHSILFKFCSAVLLWMLDAFKRQLLGFLFSININKPVKCEMDL